MIAVAELWRGPIDVGGYLMRKTIVVIATGALFWIGGSGIGHAQCPTPHGFPNQTTIELQTYADNGDSGGVVYEPTGPGIQLHRDSSAFTTASVPVNDIAFRVAAKINLNADTFPDLVVANRLGQGFLVLRNDTASSPPPIDWTNPTQVRAPIFTSLPEPPLFPTFYGQTGQNCSIALVVGDFNNDGVDDVVRMRCASGSAVAGLDFFAQAPLGTFPLTPTISHPTPASLGHIARSSTAMAATDWNDDGNLDIMVGNNATGSGGSGQVFVLVGDGAGNFAKLASSLTNISTSGASGDAGPASIAFGDFNGDGNLDLAVSSPSAATNSANVMRIYQSDGASGFDPPRSLTVPSGGGYAQALLAEDLNQDGYDDLLWVVDDDSPVGSQRGLMYFWENDADGLPFDGTGPSPTPTAIDPDAAGADLDAAVALDYDNDPLGTLDIFTGDTTGDLPRTSNNFIVANRTSTSLVTCGNLVSGLIALAPPLDTTEMVIQTVRLSPSSVTIPANTSVNFYMSIESPPSWQLAAPCTVAPTTDFCANFPPSSNREVRWRAELCTTMPGNLAATPTIGEVGLSMEYVPSNFNFRAGVVAQNGIVYAPAFRQPGNRGSLFALDGDISGASSAGSDPFLFEVGGRIDGMSDASRNLYTTELSNPAVLVPFETPSSGSLQTTLQVPDQSSADSIVTWQRSNRFVGGSPLVSTRLGSIINSTPAILNPPGLPGHYTFLDIASRTEVDSFVNGLSGRDQLALFGSMDGALHAVNVDPTAPTAVTNGTEAWGFIPAAVAQEFGADMLRLVPEVYVDGSPSLIDIYDDVNDVYKTVVVTGGGAGSSAIFALDVTDTFVPAQPAPTPLWSTILPNAGNATSKPSIIRVDNTTPTLKQGKFMAVFSTGVSDTNTSPPYVDGKTVVGVDIETGVIQWTFDAVCPVTTSISAFETDDGGFVGAASTIDGFVDQVAFGDLCGNVYLLNVNDPAVFASASPPYLVKAVGASPTGVNDADGDEIVAFFRTANNSLPTPFASERPIYGNISARSDNTTELVLYFGTGGDEAVSPSERNAFYGVYVSSGTVRSVFEGDCAGSPLRCEKFYGGSVVTEQQVIFTATVDPNGGAACDLGASRIVLAGINDSSGNFDETPQDIQVVSAAIVTPLFAAANAIYLGTQDGRILQLGDTTAATAGSAPTQGATSGGGSQKGLYIAISGWSQRFY